MKNKTITPIIQLVVVGCACLVLIVVSASAFAGEKSGGHLIVSRVANFGSDLDLVLSVDGSELARVRDGQNYDGYVSPGKHVISAVVSPNRGGARPYQTTMQIKDGETYSFSAAWDGDDLTLVKNQ